jgi:hypothetical protein
MKKSTKCRKCLVPLTPESHSPGMQGICRRCSNLKGAKWRRRNVETRRLYDRISKAKARSPHAPGYRAYLLRNSCYGKVKYAIKKGWLKRPARCEVAGCMVKRTVAHHDDYSKPLEVRWLCIGHHAEHHRLHKGPPARAAHKLKSA